jgi:chromosome segregation ATPase
MARESNISYEHVANAADAIRAKGGKATSRAVRDALGTGSMLTIGRHLNAYKAGQTQPPSSPDNAMDPNVARAINIHIAAKVQEATSATIASLNDLQAEYEALLAEGERQAAELEEVTTARAALVSENAALSGRNQQLEADNARLVADLQAERALTETARVDLGKALLRLEEVPRIQAELEKVRAELVQTTALAASQHEDAAVALAKLEGEVSLRKTLSENLEAMGLQRDAAVEAARKSATEAAELRGQLQSRT